MITEVLGAHRPYGLDCKCGEPINSDAYWVAHVWGVLREAVTVRSVEELDALPDDAVVLVDDCPARKHLGDWYFANDDGDRYGPESLALYLPAVVLYRPDWNTP